MSPSAGTALITSPRRPNVQELYNKWPNSALDAHDCAQTFTCEIEKKRTHCYSAGQSANLSVCRAAPLMRTGLLAPETLDNESGTESNWSPLVSSGWRKWSEAKQPVAIILAIDRARSVLCLICLVCQVKGGPSSACGKANL